MLSFRTSREDAGEAQRWSERLGIGRSELLRDALQRHLVRLGNENEATTWTESSLDAAERSLMTVADWGPAEDWSDWMATPAAGQ